MLALSSLLQRGFAHGVHPREYKERTAALPTQRIPFMERYVIPLHQSLGAPAKPVVDVGQRVLRGPLVWRQSNRSGQSHFDMPVSSSRSP